MGGQFPWRRQRRLHKGERRRRRQRVSARHQLCCSVRPGSYNSPSRQQEIAQPGTDAGEPRARIGAGTGAAPRVVDQRRSPLPGSGALAERCASVECLFLQSCSLSEFETNNIVSIQAIRCVPRVTLDSTQVDHQSRCPTGLGKGPVWIWLNPFATGQPNGRLWRVSPIAPNPGERLFTEPTPAVRPWSRERVFVPQRRPSPGPGDSWKAAIRESAKLRQPALPGKSRSRSLSRSKSPAR